MVRIFIAEILFYKKIFLNTILVSVFSFGILHNWPMITGEIPPNENIGYISISHMFFFFLAAIFQMTFWKKNYQYRRQMLLPVGLRQVGILRWIIISMYWITMIALFIIYDLLSRYFLIDARTVLALCAQTGMALLIFSIYFFWDDLKDTFKQSLSTRRAIAVMTVGLSLIVCFIALAGIIHTYQGKNNSVFDLFLSWLYQSNSGVMLSVLLGAILSILTLSTFQLRKSYLE
jgi:hypothetical protein